MILIDKNNILHRIVVTVSAKASDLPSYQLFLKSTFSLKVVTIPLGDNISTHQIRYDEFEFGIADDLAVGEYLYEILDANQILETGYAKIIDSGIVEVETVYDNTDDREYYIYKG